MNLWASAAPSLANQPLPAWVQVLGTIGTVAAGYLALRQANRATATQADTRRQEIRAARETAADEAENDRAKIAAAAIDQARQIYESTIKIQEQTVLGLLDGQRRLQGEVTDLRAEVREGRRERAEADRKLDAALRQLSASKGLVTKLTSRVNTLEGLLTEAGIVFPPAEDHNEGTAQA